MGDFILDVSDTYVSVACSDLCVHSIIRNAVKARPAGFQFMPRYKDGMWDGYISLYQDSKFPAGLLSLVCDELDKKGIVYRIKTDSDYVAWRSDFEIAGFELRNYQLEAIQAVCENRRGVLHMATNSGKTLVAAHIIRACGNKAVIVVPSIALLLQTAEKLEDMLQISVGRFGAGYSTKKDVTVATMQSLGKLVLEDLHDNNVLVVDECHHSRSSSIFDVVFDIPGTVRVGMSGTPLTRDKLSDLKLMGATGPIIYTVKNVELIKGGFSVPPKVKFIIVDNEWFDGDYIDAYRKVLVSNNARNKVIQSIYEQEHDRGPILVLANWIEHVKAIHDCVPDFHMVTGSDSKNKIIAELQKLANSEIPGLIATDVFGEGIDIPSISTLILAGGGKSHIKLLQRVGRGLRTDANKEFLHVYDFIDDTNRYLLKHSEIRYKLYKQEQFNVELSEVNCGDCLCCSK